MIPRDLDTARRPGWYTAIWNTVKKALMSVEEARTDQGDRDAHTHITHRDGPHSLCTEKPGAGVQLAEEGHPGTMNLLCSVVRSWGYFSFLK